MKKLSESFQNMIEVSGIGPEAICEYSKISKRQFNNAGKKFNRFPFVGLVRLAEGLGVDFDDFVNAKIDYFALKEHISGNRTFIPRRYQVYKMSKVDTICNTIDFLKETQGDFFVKKIKHKLQITDELLGKKEIKVNGILLMDIFKEISKLPIPRDSFYKIGERLCLRHSNKALKLIDCQDKKRPDRQYQAFIENIHSNVERNLCYKILHSSKKKTVVSVNTRNETKDLLRLDRFGNVSHYENILGYYSNIPKIMGSKKVYLKRLYSWKREKADLIFEVSHPY